MRRHAATQLLLHVLYPLCWQVRYIVPACESNTFEFTPPQVDGKEGEDSDVRRVLMREKRLSAWRHLKVPERDVLTVFAAVCKVC